MRPVTGHVRAQDLDILAGRLKTGRCSGDPDESAARLQYRIGADLNIAADGVEHHVAAANNSCEILDVVIDHPVRAKMAHVVVIASAGCCYHRGTEMFGELDRKAGDAAGAPLDQNGFAGFELRRIFDRPQCREASQPHGSRLGMAEAVGLFGDDRGLDGDLFRVSSLDALIGYPEHGVTDGKISDPGADRAHYTREVAAQDMRKR